MMLLFQVLVLGSAGSLAGGVRVLDTSHKLSVWLTVPRTRIKTAPDPILWKTLWPTLTVGKGYHPSQGANTTVEVHISRKRSV